MKTWNWKKRRKKVSENEYRERRNQINENKVMDKGK